MRVAVESKWRWVMIGGRRERRAVIWDGGWKEVNVPTVEDFVFEYDVEGKPVGAGKVGVQMRTTRLRSLSEEVASTSGKGASIARSRPKS